MRAGNGFHLMTHKHTGKNTQTFNTNTSETNSSNWNERSRVVWDNIYLYL